MECTTPGPSSEENAIVLPKNRGPNWKTVEDEQLVRSWLNIAQDLAIGTEQTSAIFWQRIHDGYVEAIGATERTPSAFQSRWKII
jgi:hypothetical protein